MSRPQFRLADTAQQVVGAVILAGPFVVTEEVWLLAASMTLVHAGVLVVVVAAIGYGALYGADDDRDPDAELEVAGVPVRFLSLIGVAFGAVALLALVLTAPTTFLVGTDVLADESTRVVALTTGKAVTVGALFSVVGAATADSLF